MEEGAKVPERHLALLHRMLDKRVLIQNSVDLHASLLASMGRCLGLGGLPQSVGVLLCTPANM